MGFFRIAAKLTVMGVGVHYGADQYRYGQSVVKASREALDGMRVATTDVRVVTYESTYPRCPWMRRLVMTRILEQQLPDCQPEHGVGGNTVRDRKSGITLTFQPNYSRFVGDGVFWRVPATIVASR
jgi:hypothetical protein